MRETLYKFYQSLVDSKYFGLSIFIMIVVIYIYATTPRNVFRESPEFLTCIEQARQEYVQFWHDYPKPSTEEIRQADDSYDEQTARCAENYSIAWRKWKNYLKNQN